MYNEIKTVSERIVDIIDENDSNPDSIMLKKNDDYDPGLGKDVFREKDPILDTIDKFTRDTGPFIKITDRNKETDSSEEPEANPVPAVVIGWKTAF